MEAVSAENVDYLLEHMSQDIRGMFGRNDCARFLIARQKQGREAALQMIEECGKWRNTPLKGCNPPACPHDLLKVTVENDFKFEGYDTRHPEGDIVPHALYGEDKEGRPIYWEKTGIISSTFASKVKKIWSVDELVAAHIRSQELATVRYAHLSKKYSKSVEKSVVVFDLKGINISVDLDAFSYIRQMLRIDHEYYPERLHKLFIINAPWFFSVIWNIVRPWVDPDTAAKITIIGADYQAALQECIDMDNIPVEYGGAMAVEPWRGVWREREESGCTDQQLMDLYTKLAEIDEPASKDSETSTSWTPDLDD